MNMNMNIKFFAGLFMVALFITSCEKDVVEYDETSTAVTTAQLVNSHDKISTDFAEEREALTENQSYVRKGDYTFNTLNQALHCTGLTKALFSGKKTIYAPSDAAFEKLGLNAQNVCEALDVETLTNILLYHVVDDVVRLRTKGCTTMLNGEISQLKSVNHGFFINDSQLYATFTLRSTKYKLKVYAVNNVLSVPTNNIVATAAGADMFSSLVAAVLAADPGIAAALSDEDAIFTVFAPTNQAFADLLGALNLNSLEELVEAIGVDALSTVLLYHVVDACAFSNNLEDGLKITTLQGEDLEVDLANLSILDKTGTPSGLVVEGLDILTSNGIVHTINKVLLPQVIIDAL